MEERTKAKANAIADTLGVSRSAYINALIARDELDATGKPVWWTDLTSMDEELFPMTG